MTQWMLRNCVSIAAVCGLLDSRAAAGQTAARLRATATMLAAQRALFVDRDVPKAQNGFITAIQQDPLYAAPRFNLGVLAEANNDWTEAAHWFGEYLAVDSTSAWAVKARKELEVSRHLASIPDLAQRVRAEYDRHIELGRRLVATKMLDDALGEASRAHALRPDGWEAYALASAALAAEGRREKALSMLDTAIVRAPDASRPQLRASRDALKAATQARPSSHSPSLRDELAQ